MARPRKLSIAGVNITIHPHSPDKYVSLMQDAFKLGRHYRSRGDQHLILGHIKKNLEKGKIEGSIARFTDIDASLPWFNIEKMDAAEDTEVEQRIRIPSELKPNHSAFYFNFYPKKHLLVFESYSESKRLSPGAVRSFLEKLFSDPRIVEKYGDVDVTVVADKERLNKMLGLPAVTNVKMTIKRPNPDDWAKLEARFLQELENQNMREVVYEHRAIRGKSIELDEKRKILAHIASDNGKVEVKGRDAAGKSVFRSTDDFPKTSTEQYDPDDVSARQMFNLMADKFVQDEQGNYERRR